MRQAQLDRDRLKREKDEAAAKKKVEEEKEQKRLTEIARIAEEKFKASKGLP